MSGLRRLFAPFKLPPWLWNPSGSYLLSLRSQALLRIGLGLAVLVETIERMYYFKPLLSTNGLFPVSFVRQLQIDGLRGDLLPSIHFFLTSDSLQFALVFVQFVLGLLLILGVGGRWLVLALLYFICSANLRTLAHAGGDVIFAWTALLVLVAPAFSTWTLTKVNAFRSTRLQYFGALIFMFGIYFSCGASKNGLTWIRGDAVALSISDSFMSTPFGQWLAGYTTLCRWLTYITVPLETWGVLLLLVPSPAFRLLTCAIFIGFHAGNAACFYLPTLTILTTSLWVAWIPDEFYRFVGASRLSLDTTRVRGAWIGFACLVFSALVIVTANLQFIGGNQVLAKISDRTANVAERLGIYATMKFFSPNPDRFNGWIRYVVSDGAGQKKLYDPIEQHFIPDDLDSIPHNVFKETLHSHRWKSVIRFMQKDKAALNQFATYTCTQLLRSQPGKVLVEAIYFVRPLDLSVIPTFSNFTPVTLFHKDCREGV